MVIVSNSVGSRPTTELKNIVSTTCLSVSPSFLFSFAATKGICLCNETCDSLAAFCNAIIFGSSALPKFCISDFLIVLVRYSFVLCNASRTALGVVDLIALAVASLLSLGTCVILAKSVPSSIGRTLDTLNERSAFPSSTRCGLLIGLTKPSPLSSSIANFSSTLCLRYTSCA